ncbi:MAG TPA: SelB C-terminal domain-containing protein, partial [Solirubrobacteraceae bacterium]|nr:SelB C-terminal domain-containing protein [Solirubrobacteraceae bacterium]
RLAALERGETPAAPAPPRPEPPPAAPPPLTPHVLEVEERLRAAGAEPPLDDDPEALAALRAHGRAVRLGPAMHVHADVLAAVRERLVAAIERDGSITLARARDELGTSRKYAQAYLERLDAERVTLRRGDERVLRTRRASAR